LLFTPALSDRRLLGTKAKYCARPPGDHPYFLAKVCTDMVSNLHCFPPGPQSEYGIFNVNGYSSVNRTARNGPRTVAE
jgi:hypothetical protein